MKNLTCEDVFVSVSLCVCVVNFVSDLQTFVHKCYMIHTSLCLCVRECV